MRRLEVNEKMTDVVVGDVYAGFSDSQECVPGRRACSPGRDEKSSTRMEE